MKKNFALVDCNNFYVSCEQAFNPKLKGKPVVVLSNNDGCVVSRSQEAKALQIPMAAPYFQHKKKFEYLGGVALSSNYELYADMSDRVMQSLRYFCPEIEIYSIDEAFLPLEELVHSPEDILKIRQFIQKWTGITVSIGIASTKVLAKIANQYAKKKSHLGIWMAHEAALEELLPKLPVEEIWGISTKTGQKLRQLGIQSAEELKRSDPYRIREYLSVAMERIVWELRGKSCLTGEDVQPKKTILSSRSFAKNVRSLHELEEAISNYTLRASEKLRAQKSRAQGLCVFLRTSHHPLNGEGYSASLNTAIPATNNSSTLIQEALNSLKKIFKEGYAYHKTGIMLWNLIPDSIIQQDCFVSTNHEKSDRLMNAFDQINRQMGSGTLFYASQGIDRTWKIRSDHRSSRYTTCWDELPFVY